MELYPGADLIECEIGGRPLYLPLLHEGRICLLLDCGTRNHALQEIPQFLQQFLRGEKELTWAVITHPDGDHCGGLGEIKRRNPGALVACGEADRQLIESPDYLFTFRYDAYRKDHGIFYDSRTAAEIRSCSSSPQPVSLTFTGGEIIRLGGERILEIWHLPGHSHGHLGVFDRSHGALFYGDAIQGAGYRSLDGSWALCPTYLYVDAYLRTIDTIENSGAEMIIGCHWPILRGREEIRQFCSESRDFVSKADALITEYLLEHPSGVSLRELCEALSSRLGAWPHTVSLELANAFAGHLDRGVRTGRLEVDQSSVPHQYHTRNGRS
jgi:glyoxylase-like metal-dependent hydrolase (beta-lactamase superfamily II)